MDPKFIPPSPCDLPTLRARVASLEAQVATLALENARLSSAAEEPRPDAEVGAELVQTIGGSLDLDFVLQRFVEGARDICGSDLAVLAMREDWSDRPVFTHGIGIDPEALGSLSIQAGIGLVGQVLTTERPARIDSYPEEAAQKREVEPLAQAEKVVAAIAIPVRSEHAVDGVLYLGNRVPRPFTDRHEAVLVWLAHSASIAIRNARLYVSEQVAHATTEASEQRFRDLIQGLDAIVWEADLRTWQPTFVSQRAESILGYPVEQWLTEPEFWANRLHPEDRDQAYATARASIEADRDFEHEYRMLAQDGRVVWLRDTVRIVRDAARPPRRLRGVMVDITALKQTTEALRVSNQTLQALIEASPLAIHALAPDGTVTLWTPAAERIFGWSPAEAVGRPNPIIPPDRLPEHEALRARLLAGEGFTEVELKRQRKDGTSIDISLSTAPLRDATGAVTGIMGIAADITQRKQLEAQLRQAQKLEAIGRLAGGVAHDFNNLLTAILGYTELLLLRLDPQDPLRLDVAEIKAAADRAAALTRQLLAFSRKQVLQPKILDLNGVVRGVEKILRRLLGEDVSVVTTLAEPLPPLQADPGQLEQILLNLAVNARDAMPHGGTLTLRTAAITRVGAGGTPPVPPGSYVRLQVADTGVGMDSATLAHLFEPFFTTKASGQGTGLGLATVYGIVQQSGGTISVASTPGAGTTLSVDFPAVAALLAPAPAGAIAPDLPLGVETLLLAEDDAGVRGVVTEILRGLGYTVLVAATGSFALATGRAHAGPLHLLLTDVVMPELSGPELAVTLTAERPDLRVLYMSGYTEEAVIHHGAAGKQPAFLRKPFTPAALARTVRTILDEK
jgi:two-component system cell cycle sensor histidine kinase/response regulator CckA